MNEAEPTGRESRRDFLRGGARYALLAGLGAVSATLVKRSGGKLSGQTCINQGFCSGCKAYAGCGLPAALSRKQIQSRSSRRKSAQTSAKQSQSLLTSAATSEREAT
ncbi:MAG: hypothetical protein EPO07_14745 [Verrucomicrobia bacterium]|nr:MAG: hypothetical protein EPO07_14745 [Verrucomicrobiota bacterium]